MAGFLTLLLKKNDRGMDKGQLFAAALWKFVVEKLSDILFYSQVTSCVLFAIARRSQMKPADPKKLPVWSGKKRVRGLCGCGWKSPPGELWLKWVGEDKGFEDLPPRPPTYFIKPGRCYACCARYDCCCVCCDSGVATWLARRETGDKSVDADDARTLAKYKYLAVYGEGSLPHPVTRSPLPIARPLRELPACVPPTRDPRGTHVGPRRPSQSYDPIWDPRGASRIRGG